MSVIHIGATNQCIQNNGGRTGYIKIFAKSIIIYMTCIYVAQKNEVSAMETWDLLSYTNELFEVVSCS